MVIPQIQIAAGLFGVRALYQYFQDLGNKKFWYPRAIGFFLFQVETPAMSASAFQRFRRVTLWLALDLLVAAGLLALSAWADTSMQVRKDPAGGCYCGCGMSRTSAGCGKMCELPKYASRWWAVSCAKPRPNAPTENPNARPHLPHPPRSERASN
jgi:hypothetical protein